MTDNQTFSKKLQKICKKRTNSLLMFLRYKTLQIGLENFFLAPIWLSYMNLSNFSNAIQDVL